MENPVPDNLDQVKKLNDFLRDILKDKRKQKRFGHGWHIWKNSVEECLCDGPSVKVMDVSGRDT